MGTDTRSERFRNHLGNFFGGHARSLTHTHYTHTHTHYTHTHTHTHYTHTHTHTTHTHTHTHQAHRAQHPWWQCTEGPCNASPGHRPCSLQQPMGVVPIGRLRSARSREPCTRGCTLSCVYRNQ